MPCIVSSHFNFVYFLFTCKNYLVGSLVSGIETSSLPNRLFAGFDLGTSGARISIIDENHNQLHSESTVYEKYDNPKSWTHAMNSLLNDAPKSLISKITAICVSGTSASCLIINPYNGKINRSPKMYDYDISHDQSERSQGAFLQAVSLIETYAPENHTTRARTSALSKLLHYHFCQPLQTYEDNQNKTEVLAHQSEYVANELFLFDSQDDNPQDMKRLYVSDWHNALKLGYDVKKLEYPSWLHECLDEAGIDANFVLPSVVAPGETIQHISESARKKFGLPNDCMVVGGTTDSNAAFVAAADEYGSLPRYGTAVTSLGSTLALKMLSGTFVEDSKTGVYSHRFPGTGKKEAWLVGGASNVGCAVLRQENFSNKELLEISRDMEVTTDTDLKYYPLTKKGERFPIADGSKKPILDPKPCPYSRSEYLKGILQGISEVERSGYELLGKLGADPPFPTLVWTCGGGSKNDAWIRMRERLLRESHAYNSTSTVAVKRANNAEASFGAAILAASSFR